MGKTVILMVSFILILTTTNAQVKGVEGENGKWKLINSKGKMIGPSVYDNMGNNGEFTDGLLSVTKNGKCGYIDTTGKIIVPLKYDECDKFTHETATVWLGENCGLIDRTGKLIIPVKYSMVDDTRDNTIVQVSTYNKTTETAKFGLFTRSGKVLLPISYDEIGYIINGITMLKQSKHYGYYIVDTKMIIPCKYDEAKNFTEGFAAVAINKKWGFIDTRGTIALELEYDIVKPLENGYTEVWKNDVSSILSKQLKTPPTPGGKDEFTLASANTKSIPVPSTEREVIPGVISMDVPNTLMPKSGDLYGNVSIYTDERNFLYFKKDDNKNAISYLDAMLQFKKWKTSAGFSEIGSINYSAPSKIAFVGFYGLQQDPIKSSEFTDEAYVFFSKPGGNKDSWIIHYRLSKGSTVKIENDIEAFLKTVKVK